MAKKKPNAVYQGWPPATWLAGSLPIVKAESEILEPERSQSVINHSPDGFSWGYGGSGPAQLALAILLDYYDDAGIAKKYYQDFKWQYTAKIAIDSNWILSGAQIEEIIAKIEAERRECGRIEKETAQGPL